MSLALLQAPAPAARAAGARRRAAPRAPCRPSASRKPNASGSEPTGAPGPATPPQPSASAVRRDTRVLRSQLAALSQDLMAYEPQSFALDSPTPPLIPVVFRVQYNTRLGQEILLVGSSPHLGEWSVANSITLRWTEGGVWTATLSLPAGGIFFYKFFMREDGYLKEWQAGNNVMLVLPNSAGDLAGGAVVAESSWTGAPTSSSLQSEARVMQRLQAAETVTRQAEAAAQAAGLVAQSVMGELILAREEAAVAMRFIKEKGLEGEFEGLIDPDNVRRLNEQMAGAGFAPPSPAATSAAAAPRKGRRGGPAASPARPGMLTDAEIDAEINSTLAAQLAGQLDLSDGDDVAGGAQPGRVDLSGGDAWEAAPVTRGSATAQSSGGAMPITLGSDASEPGRPDVRSMSR